MNNFYAYTRVSTTKQGEHGVSLQEQRSAIERYAQSKGFKISNWFEEQVSAAKRGRPVFLRMIRQLKLRQAAGVVIHKIDRSARNLRDWADIGELVDAGVQIHFSNEAMDMSSRGGRLSADIQAVIASDFIRNLREETKKGFYGRLKQGLLPMPAPIGYLNVGKGKPKIPDPEQAPLVRQCFELYQTGGYSIQELVDEMFRRGLRSRKGGKVGWHGVWKILNRPFYAGLIAIAKTGETFQGAHEPLITVNAFREVRDLLKGKVVKSRVIHEDYLFRQTFTCASCGKILIGEQQKGVVYYRCHSRDCYRGSIREDRLQSVVVRQLKHLEFAREEVVCLGECLKDLRHDWVENHERAVSAARATLEMVKSREGRLTDAYLDGVVDEKAYRERTAALRLERCEVENKLKELTSDPNSFPDTVANVLELAKSAYLTYRSANVDQKRELLKVLCSNHSLDPKRPILMLDSVFKQVAERSKLFDGSPSRGTPRTFLTCREVVKNVADLVVKPATRIPQRRVRFGLLFQCAGFPMEGMAVDSSASRVAAAF